MCDLAGSAAGPVTPLMKTSWRFTRDKVVIVAVWAQFISTLITCGVAVKLFISILIHVIVGFHVPTWVQLCATN